MTSPIAKLSKVWITGAGGLIGNYLLQTAPEWAPEITTIGIHRSNLDLTDEAMVRRSFARDEPDGIIHCAALSKSPECQAKPALAQQLNVDVTRLLAELTADRAFVVFSTDMVFDGQKGNYSESDAVNPLSIYAETKVAAEQITLANPRHTVIRTSLNGGCSPTGDRGFNEQIRNAWRKGQSLSFFAAEFRNPIPAAVTARAAWELLRHRRTGLYHVAGAERLSRAQLGAALAARCPELKPHYHVGSLRDYHGPPRSPDTSLNCEKVQRVLSFPLPRFSDWLQENPTEGF